MPFVFLPMSQMIGRQTAAKASMAGSTRAGINMDAVLKMAGIIKATAEATADRLEQTCTALRVIEQMAVAVVDCCGLHKLRLEAHELAHRVGNAEHRDQTLQGVVVGDDVFQIALAGLHRVDDIHEIAQCHIGVAGVGQHAQQFT